MRSFMHHYTNPQAVGGDSGAPFSLSNFLEDILQSTSFKMSTTSNSGLKLLFLIINLTIIMIHLFKLCHRKKVLENFRKFISQERHIRISM